MALTTAVAAAAQIVRQPLLGTQGTPRQGAHRPRDAPAADLPGSDVTRKVLARLAICALYGSMVRFGPVFLIVHHVEFEVGGMLPVDEVAIIYNDQTLPSLRLL